MKIKTEEINKTYVLIRVSSDKQDFNSQLEGIKNYCYCNNIELLDEHIIKEFNVSGYKTKIEDREGLNKILQLAQYHLIDNLIIFNLDRIGRRTDLLPFIAQLTLANVTITSVTEGIINSDNDVTELMTYIKLWASQGESKKTSVRVKNGKLKAIKDGIWQGGRVNLGYKVINKKLTIDENIAPIIREAYNVYINNGTQDTINYLKTHNINKNSQTLTQMLKNPIYKGVYAHDKNLYTKEDYDKLTIINKELQIVNENIWQLARDKANERRTSYGTRCKSLNRSDCVYEGLLEHWCGNKLTIDYDYRKATKKMMFRCKHCKKYHKDDYQKSYVAHKLIEGLDKKIDNELMNLDRDKLTKLYLEASSTNINMLYEQSNSIREQLDEEKKILTNANNKLKLMMINDIDVDTIKIITDLIKDTKQKINILEVELSKVTLDIKLGQNKLNSHIAKIDKFLEMKDIYHMGDYKQKRAVLQLIIDKIVVYTYDDIKVFLKF